MQIQSAAVKPALIAMCLMMLCGSTDAADDCSVADVLVNSWVRMARNNSPGLPITKATRRELEFKTNDQVALKGYSYSPPSQESETAAQHFVLLLQGSASSAAQLAETASRLALAAEREVFVYEYRGYAPESTVHPTGAAIQGDIDAIIDSLSEGGRRGVVIGLSMGGIFAIQSLKRSLKRPERADLRVLLDSAPAQVPTIPFVLRCPRWMNPLDAATADVVQRLGVLYGADDGWSKDRAAKELMEKVKAGGGRMWMIEGGHVDLSLSGLAVRLPIYVDFVQERLP
ncbi:MAG TPA: alpha/beta hydrolase [Burkholderiaceae bacterium]|nr:alpha/beta hydrolase [Burkholderiaceae bacterium]